MRTTRTITASLAAILAAAVLAGPAGAIPGDTSHHPPNTWHAGQSMIQGSFVPDSSREPATANVYVPPRQLTPNVYVAPGAAVSPRPTSPPPGAAANATSSGFDWGSGGIGAAAGIGAFAIALAGTAGMRRRRVARPPSATAH